MKLFRKNMEKRCAYCAHGAQLNEREVACKRKGVVSAADHCFRFSYDPLKRVPPRPVTLQQDKFDAEDFKL